MRRVLTFLLDRPWTVIAVAGVAVLGIIGINTRSDPHHVRVSFAAAVNLVHGATVQAAGVPVGHVSDIQYEDGHANVELGIADQVWPLPRGTTAEIVPASVAGNVNRRIYLHLGPRGAPGVPDGGIIGATNPAPVELDDVFQTFDAPTRANLAGSLNSVSRALGGHEAQLNGGLHATRPVFEAADPVMRDLAASDQRLSHLISTGSAVTSTLAARSTAIGSVVDTMATTMRTLGQRSRMVQRTIEAAAPAFRQVQITGARLRPTLKTATGLLTDLRPGVAELPALATAANPALRALRRTAPVGVRLADTAIAGAPAITALLRQATPFVKRVTPVVKKAMPIAHCLRPYTPEIAATFSNWAGFNVEYDAIGHLTVAFADATGTMSTDTAPVSSSDLVHDGLIGGAVALPPPGWHGGQPEFLPECGITPAVLDPANDWDDKP